MNTSDSKFFSADNLRVATLLFFLLGAMWALNVRLEDRLTKRIDKLEENMNDRFEKIDARLDSFGERIAKNEARLDAQ